MAHSSSLYYLLVKAMGEGGQDSVHPCGTLAAVLGDIGEERAPGNTRWVRHAECSLGVDH